MKTADEYMKLPYRLELIPDPEEGGYTAFYPDLPGCLTCGETPKKQFRMRWALKKAWLQAALEDGTAIAEPSSADHWS